MAVIFNRLCPNAKNFSIFWSKWKLKYDNSGLEGENAENCLQKLLRMLPRVAKSATGECCFRFFRKIFAKWNEKSVKTV